MLEDIAGFDGTIRADKAACEAFITALTGAADTPVTWQTFDDTKDRKLGSLIKVMNCNLTSGFEALQYLNQGGAGIFITVNETDLKGRRGTNIKRVRAVYADFDTDDAIALADAAAAKLKPSIVVASSPTKRHLYWLIDDPEFAVKDFRPLMDSLVERIGSDAGAKDVSRVLRPPGFWHRKGEPVRTQLLETNPVKYTKAQIIEAFGIEVVPVKKAKSKVAPKAPKEGAAEHPVAPEIETLDEEVVADLRSALSALDADSRDVWIMVAGSLATCGEVGFALFHEWSKTSAKYVSEDDCRATFNDVAGAPKSRYPAIFTAAMVKGWKKLRPSAEEEFAAELAWPDVQVDVDPKSEALPPPPNTDDPIPMYAETLNADQMTQRFCYIEDGQRVVDRKDRRRTMSLHDFKAAYICSWTPTPTQANPHLKTASTKLWMFNPGKMQLSTLTWRPGYPERTRSPDGRTAFNTYMARKLPMFEFVQSYVDAFLTHIKMLFGDRADDFLNWFAHIEQRPGELPHTAWLHVASKTGLGRNWIAALALRMWPGEVASGYNMATMLDSNFNEELSRKRLIIVDEIRAGGMAGHKMEQRLKSIITEETRVINPKYGVKMVEYNCARWLLLSNHRSALPIDGEDRRYEVCVNDSSPEDDFYYQSLYERLKDKNFVLSVLTYLRNRDISMFNPGQRAKATAEKSQVVETSRSPISQAIGDVARVWSWPVISYDTLIKLADISPEDERRNRGSIVHSIEDHGWVAVPGKVRWRGQTRKLYILRDRFAEFKDSPKTGLPTDAEYDAFIGMLEFDEVVDAA